MKIEFDLEFKLVICHSHSPFNAMFECFQCPLCVFFLFHGNYKCSKSGAASMETVNGSFIAQPIFCLPQNHI